MGGLHHIGFDEPVHPGGAKPEYGNQPFGDGQKCLRGQEVFVVVSEEQTASQQIVESYVYVGLVKIEVQFREENRG